MERIKTNQTNILHKELSYKLVGCIYTVRNSYGSGQKEIVYQNALAETFDQEKLPYQREARIAIRSIHSGKVLGTYTLDFVVDAKIIVETKALKFLPRKTEQQLYSYLRSTPYEVGYLVNFGSPRLYCKRIILTNDRKDIRSIRVLQK